MKAARIQLSKFELIGYVAAIIFLFVLWYQYKWNRRHIEKLDRKLNGPPAYPIIGSLLMFVKNPKQILETIAKINEDYGPEPYKLWLGTTLLVNIIKPEDIQIVLNSSNALEKGPHYRFLKTAIGDGLLTAQVDKWRKHSRLIGPAFNSIVVGQFFPVFNEKAEILVRKLRKEVGQTHVFDLWDYIYPTTFDIICQTSMGCSLDVKSKCVSEFMHAFDKGSTLVGMRFFKPWLYPDILFDIYLSFTGQKYLFRTLKNLPNKVFREIKEINAQKKVAKETGAIYDTDDEGKRFKIFIDTLLELNQSGANFTDDEIVDEVVTMMIAGSETSGFTISNCLLLLAIHQDVQHKVYDEIYSVFGDGDRTITVADTTKLMYLRQAIYETLRLCPPAPMILRQLQDDVKISSGNLVLPKGTSCLISLTGMHHLAELYPNPWTFNLDNFSPENVAKRHKFGYLPFSGGLRKCIGYKFAMLSMIVLLSTFLRNYSVHTDIKFSDIKFEFGVLMKNVNGYPVTIQQRDRRPSYQYVRGMH